MRYLLKFSKGSDIKFVAHLDIMRTIQRCFKRANLPVEYSKGFNPHMILSIAQPLSVGMYSDGEYMDIEFKEEVDLEEIINKFNNSSPEGVKISKVVKISESYYKDGKKVPQSMAAVDGARYFLTIKLKDVLDLDEQIKNLFENDQWNIIKKSKKGEKEVNIRPMIKEFKFWVDENNFKINTLVSCGSRENLSAELLGEYIINNTEGIDKDAFVDIKREEMYGIKNKKFVPLWSYFTQK